MKTRGQIYSREAAGLLRDISMYRVVKEGQLLRLYASKEAKIKNLLSYLVKQRRIIQEGDTYFASPGCVGRVDKSLTSALWVLADFADRVEYHSTGDFPTQIIFFADGEVYEIIPAGQGREALMAHLLGTQGEEPSRYLVLVDDPAQIAQLGLPNACGYCTVSPDGEVQYYQTE